MIFAILAQFIGLLGNALMILIFIWVVLSWILQPFHPVRQALDRLVDPLLMPIRRVLPMAGPLDFSPLVLLILIQLVTSILTGFLRSL